MNSCILLGFFPEPHDSSHRGSRALATRLDLINKPTSGCVPIACDGLVTTNLLLSDLLQVDCQNLLSTGLLLQVISTSCNKSANDKLHQA